ncbi:hypothetical protein WA026_005000 [Henosepilachna vigintioctopunctata]|uniref:Ig-like domain-containing protein n=1 Tax=Henosepilachna vigintioctopunctata TaxID=420089 RepID=A0AAW1UMP2_9CUCU
MYIICFVALMILNQNIILITQAKPLLTNTNQLNSPRDFDNIVDWTGTSNDKTKNDKNENHNFEDINNGGKLRLKQRSIPTTYTKDAKDSAKIDLEEIDKTILNILPPLKDQKTKRGSEDVDEVNNLINDYADNMSGFGEKLGKLYKRMRNKITGKKCENCMNKIEENDPIKLYGTQNYYGNKMNFIPAFKRSVPMCLLNERHGSAYYSPLAGTPSLQPILMNKSPSYVYPSLADESARYEVHWMDSSPNSPSYQRARRQVLLNDKIFSLMSTDEIEKNDDLLEAQKELVKIVKSINTEFFAKNNLTFLPIIFNPEASKIDNTADDWLSEAEFQDADDRCHEKRNQFPLDSVDHFTVVLMSNNTINLVIPVERAQKKNYPRHSENAVEQFEEYLKQTFNFSDSVIDPRDDQTVVPGILVFPSHYSFTSPKPNEESSHSNCEGEKIKDNIPKYYYVNSETIGSAKSKRSLDSRDGSAKKAWHSKRDILEKEKRDADVHKGIETDPVADKGTVGESNANENQLVADKFKAEDAHLEKEIKDMIHNEQLIESSEIEDHSTIEVKTYVSEAIFTESMELLPNAAEVPAVEISNELEYSTESSLDSSESCTSETESETCANDIDIGECAECPEETTSCEIQEELTGEPKNKNVRHLAPANEIHSKAKERKADYLSRESTESKKQKHRKRRKRKFQRSRRDVSSIAITTTLDSKQEVESSSKAVEKKEVEPSKETDATESSKNQAVGKNHKTIASVATESTNCSPSTTDVPDAISEYTASNVMDENDECMTETLNRLLRDVSLVDKVQNILEGIKDAGYAIRQAVRKKSKRRARSFRDRNLLSLKTGDKYSKIHSNDEKNEKALNGIVPQGINRKLFSVDTPLVKKDDTDGFRNMRGRATRYNKRRKHSAKNWPRRNVFAKRPIDFQVEDLQQNDLNDNDTIIETIFVNGTQENEERGEGDYHNDDIFKINDTFTERILKTKRSLSKEALPKLSLVSEEESNDNNKISAKMDHSFVDMAGTGRYNLPSDGEIENEPYISIGRKQKRHVHRRRKKLHRRRKSKKKLSTSTEIFYSFPSLNDTYERLKKIDILVNSTEITKRSDSLESSTSVYQTDNENSNDEFDTLESSQLPDKTMDGNSNEASETYESSSLHHQEDSDEGPRTSKSSTLHHQTSSKNSKSSSNIFERELDDIIQNDKELDESFSIIEETTILSSHPPNKSEETPATTDFTSSNMDHASSSEGFSLSDENTFLPSEYQVDIIQQLATLTEYPPTKRKVLKDQAFKRSQENIYPLNSRNEIIKNVNNHKKPHPVHHTRVEYEKVDSTEPVSSLDNSDYENVDDEDYIEIQLPFEKPHRKYTERFVEKREPLTESDKSDPKNKNQHLLSKMKFDRRFNRRRLFATSTAFWRGFKWPDFEESFDSIIRDSDKLLQKDVTPTKPSTKADFLWAEMFTTSAAEGNTETENKALYEKMEPNDKNVIESPNLYSDILESSTFEGSESRKQIGSNLVNINEISAVSDIETLHSVIIKTPEMISTSHFELPEFSEYQKSEKKVETKAKVEAGTVVEDYSKQTKSFLSFSWPDHMQYTTSSPVEIISGAVKQENKSEGSTTEGYTSNKLPTNEVLNQSSYKTSNNSVTEKPRTRMQKMKEKAKFWKNFIWPDHQTYSTAKVIETSSEAVNTSSQVMEGEMKKTSQKITTTEKEERSTKIIEGTNYSVQLTNRSYNTEKLEHEGLISSAEEKKTEQSTSPSANKENVKKHFLFHLKGRGNKTSGTERKSFELPFQWPSDEVFENETSEKPISISGFEAGKNKTKISDESVSMLANFKWPDHEKFDYTSANMPMTEKITSELPSIKKWFTTSSHTKSKPGESTRNVWGQFQWPEHELFSYHHIDTEKQKGTPSSTSKKWGSEEWGFSLDQDVKDILEETERKTLLLHEGTPYPSKLTLSPTKPTTRGERIELVEDMADFKDLSGKLEDLTIKGPMKVSAKHKANAQVTESEDDEGLWKFRVLEPGEVIKHHKRTRKPFFESPTIYSFKPIGTPIDEWLQFNEDLQERTVTEPTVSKRTKSTFFIWKTEPITSTESTEFDEEIFEQYSTLSPLESASETTEFFNVETTLESSSSKEYTIPEIITTREPTFSSDIYDYLGQTESTALKFDVSSFIRNFMKKLTVKMQNTAVGSSQTPTISREADKEKLGSIQSIIEDIALSTISQRVEEEKLSSTQSSFEEIVQSIITEKVEEEKLGSTQIIIENIVLSTISEKVEGEKLGNTQIIIENIVPSTISEKVGEEKLGSTQIFIENIVPSTISEKVEEEKVGSTQINIGNIVPSTISEKVEEEKLGSTQIIIENIVPSMISEHFEEEKLGSTQIFIENIVPSTISEKVEEGNLGSTQIIIENTVPSKISKKVEEEKLSSTQINIGNIVPSTISEKVEEEKLGSTQIIIENIVPSIISEKFEEEKLGSTQIIIENTVSSTISEEKVEEEELRSTRTIMESIVPSKYAFQEKEDHRGSPSSSEQTTVYKTSSTPMTPAETYSRISEKIYTYGTEEPSIEKTQEVLKVDQMIKEIESEDVNVERTSSTWLFETNHPEYSRGQSDEYYMNDMKKSEEFEVKGEFLLEKMYQTTEESVFTVEAQSALAEDMQRSPKPVISIESELGTTVQYFQELKGFDNLFRPAESTKISYEEEFTKQPYEIVFGTQQVKQYPKFTLLEENGHIESKIVKEVTIGGEISTNEQESEILEELFTETNAQLYSELLKLTENEFKDKWKYDLNLARSTEKRYPPELIRTPAVQENLHPKMVHLPGVTSTSHGEQLGNELDQDILHITQKKTEETRKEDMQIKEEYDNNMNHLPENLLQETSTICQICDEQSSYEADLQIGKISKTPKLTSRRYKLIPVNYKQEGIEINRPVPTKKGNIFIFNQKPTSTSPSSTFTELKVQSLREQGTTENVQEVPSEEINAETDKTSLKEYLALSSIVTEEESESISEKNDKFLTKQWKESKFLDILKSETNTESVSIENIPVNKEEHETFSTEYYSTEKTKYRVDIENTKVENTLSTTEFFKLDMVGENLSSYAEGVFGLKTPSVGEEKLNDFQHSLTPIIDITSKSKTTEMKGKEKDKSRTKKITFVENVYTTMMSTETTEKKEEYENNMLHLPENKQEGTSTLCETCDIQAEYVVGIYPSTSNPKVHKTPKTYGTTNIKFKVNDRTHGPYHFEGIKINRPLPTESHNILPFKMYSTSYSEQQESNTASKGVYHPQSSITKARTDTSYVETTLNVSQEVITTTETNTAPKESHSKEVNPQELITTSERNMFSMETESNETAQKLLETANENTTPVETFSSVEIPQNFVTTAEENTIPTGTFALAEENATSLETFPHERKPQGLVTVPEKNFSETFSIEKVLPEIFTTPEKNTVTFINENTLEELVTMVPINISSLKTFSSEKSLHEYSTKAEESAGPIEIFTFEKKLQELTTKRVENTAPLEAFPREKIIQELATTPEKTTVSFPNEYSLKELVNTTDINTVSVNRTSIGKNTQELIASKMENTTLIEILPQEKNSQESMTTKEETISSLRILPKQTISQEFVNTPQENTVSSVNEYNLEEFINVTEIKTASVETASSEKNTQQFISIEKEKTVSIEIFPHGKSPQETITKRGENTTSLGTYSKETIPEAFVTTLEKNAASIVDEYSNKEFVNTTEMNTASFSSEKNTQEFVTIEHENISTIEIFPQEKNLQEWITTKEKNTASWETFSKGHVSQELIYTLEENTASIMNKYSLKELVNTAEINTAPMMSISNEKFTPEFTTIEKENIASVEIFPHEKNLQEWITTKEKNTASSEIFSKGQVSQQLNYTSEGNTASIENTYNTKELVNTAEINTAPMMSISNENITPELLTTEKENIASVEILLHEKNRQEWITTKEENTASSEIFSKGQVSEELSYTSEGNTASIKNTYSSKELVNTAEINTAPMMSILNEKITPELFTTEKENIASVEIFPHEKNLQEWITTKEKNTASSEILSKGQVSQELSYISEGNTASIKEYYSPKELVNTAEINTAHMMSISNEKITPELFTTEKENIASVEIFPHEKNLQEWITTKEKNTASSEIFSKEQVSSQELSYISEENTAFIKNNYSSKELVNTAEVHTISWMPISSGKYTQELITLENENISSIEIFPHEKQLQELIITKGENTAYSEIFSKEKISQELISTTGENTEVIVDKYSLEKLFNTAEMNTDSLEPISSEKSIQEVITEKKKNTVPIESSPHEKSVPELITSKEGNTVSPETFSREKLLQEFITTPNLNNTSFLNEYSPKEIANTAEMKTAPIELISREKITQELITIGKENTTSTGIFPHEKNLYELITSKEGSTVSAETFSAEKLIQELIITPEKRNISFLNEYSLKEFDNTEEINTMASVSREMNIQELITIEKGKTASIEILPHEKNLHELIVSKERSTVFAENFSNWKILEESSTTSDRNITKFVEEYRPQDFITTAEMKTGSMETLPSEKNSHELFTKTQVNISFIEEFLVENFTQQFSITPHGSTVAIDMFSNGKELDEFIFTTERNTGSTEKLSMQNAPQEISTSANSISPFIESLSNEIITAARMTNEETSQEFIASSRINTALTEKAFNEKTNTETIRKELYDTEPVRQSENTIIFETVTESTFASSTPKKTTEKNLNTNTKNLNLVNNERIGSEISTKNLHETKMFITSLSKRSTTENEGKTSLKLNLVKKEWQDEMEDEFEMLHLPHVDRYETSTICEICSESEDVEISTIQVLQSEERSSEKFQSIPETVSAPTNKRKYEKIMSTEQIEREEEYESNMLNLPRNEQAETSTLCEICDEQTQYERIGHISSIKADFEELATSILGTQEINKASIFPYSFTGIEINRPIPTQNLNIVPFKMYSSTITELSNANIPKMNYLTASTEALSKEAETPLSITEELYETEHEGQSEKPANTIQEDINIKPVIFSTLNQEEVVTKFHSKKKLGTITDEYIGSFVTENLETDTYLSMDTSVEKESNDDYEMLHLPRMDKHETSTICEICSEAEDIQTPKPQLFTAEKLSKPKSYLSTESVSEHMDEEKASTENFDYVEERNMLKLPEIRKDETSTLCEICDEETGADGSTIKTVLFESLDTSKPELTAEQEAITSTDSIGRIIINRPIPTQNMNVMPFNVHSTMYNIFTKSEEEFLFQNFLTSSTEASHLMEPLGNVTSESVSEILQETEIINQSKQPYPGIALLSPGILDELESSVISQSSSPNEFTSQFEVMEIHSDLNLYTQASLEELKDEYTDDLLTRVLDELESSVMSQSSSPNEFTSQFEVMEIHSDSNLYTQASPEELKDEFTEDLLTKELDETKFSRLLLLSSLEEFTPQFQVEGKEETIFENAKSEEVTLESVDEILHADESVYRSKQSYNEITILPSDLMEDLNLYTQASSEELKDEATENLLTKDLDENEFPGISLPSSLIEFTRQFEVEEEAKTIHQNAKPEEVTLENVDEILHADETVDHSKQSYNGITLLPTDLMEDLNVHTEASSEKLKYESTEDLLTKVLDETEFPGISVASSIEEFTSQFEVDEAEKMFQNVKPEEVTSQSVDEILHESEIVNLSKPYSGITFLPSDLMEISADLNLYTQASSEEVKVEITEDLLTKVLDETEFPQITLSPSLEEDVAQLQTEEAETILRITTKDQFPSEPIQHLHLDQYETTSTPHYDHILRTLPFSTTKKVLETSTQSAEVTSHKLDEHEYRGIVHSSLNTEYRKTEPVSTSKQDTREDLLISSTIHTKKPITHRPISYKFEGIKINRPVPTENTNIIHFKMLPATEPRLCKFGEEEFPHEKYISSTHKSTLHAESSSVESRTSELVESHETGKISEAGIGYETRKEILSITEQASATSRAISSENTPIYSEGLFSPSTELKVSNEINATNFSSVNLEHGMKEQSSTLYFLKALEDMSGFKTNTISDHESSILELTSETVSLKDEEAMAEREKSETYVHLSLKSDETASMLSSLLEYHTSEMTKHDKHVSFEESFEEGFRETQEAYTHPFMKERVELDKDLTNYNVLSSEIHAQSTLGVNETIEKEIEKQYSEKKFPGSALPTEEKVAEVVSSKEQLLIPTELNKKLESLDSVVSEIFTSTFSPVQNLITVEREFQTINMETDILENELKELNVDFSEMLATTIQPEVLLERLEGIIEPSSRQQLNTEAESIVHSSHYISEHSELLGVSEESIKNTKPEISEKESTETLNPFDHKAQSKTITEWSDAMVEKLLVPLSSTENLTAAKESGMGKYSQEMNLATTISATEVTVIEHEFLSVSSNESGELYKPNVILSKGDELLLTSFPEPNSEPNFLATLNGSPSSTISTENMVEQYEWEEKVNLSASQLITETEGQLERETSPKYTLSTETPMMEHEIFSQSSNILQELYTSSVILSEKETLYTQYLTQSNTEENFLATLLEEGNVKVSTETSLKEESMKYSPEEELSAKPFTNIMVHETSPPFANTLEDYALTSSLWQKESETEYLTESESKESFLATLLEEGHAEVSTKTTLKEQDRKYFSEKQVTERTITNIMEHEISPTSSSTLKVFYHPITDSSQRKESETEYLTGSGSEESFLATLIEEGHAEVSTKTTLKEVDMKYFSEKETTKRIVTNTLDHEISPTSSSTRIVFYHPITSSTQQKESETEYLTESNSEEIMLGTLIENETSSILTERATEEYRSEGMKGFSESQLVTEGKGEKKQSPAEYISSIESTITQHTEASGDYSLQYSSSSLLEKEAAKTEYVTELSSEEIFLATLVENKTTELSIEKTGAALDENFLTDLEETTTVGLYNTLSSEKLPAENISETNSEEVFLNTLFEEEMVNISTGNTVFSVETTVKHFKTSISSNILEESFNYSAISTEHELLQAKNFTKINSEESFLASLVESEVTKTLPENTSEKYDWHRKDTTSKSPGVEKISGIPLLTTLLLSLVASSTQHPDTNQISGHYKMNTQENQTFPKCLVVFFTGENASNPMISLNGTKWIPSHGPFVAEETTTSLNGSMSQMSQSTENTSPEAKSVTTELSEDDTSEETETSSSVVLTTEEIIDTSNFIQGGCTEADFENNNNCFCMLDLTIDHVAGEFQPLNSSNLNKVECSTFLKVNTGLIIKDEKSTAKRKKRSYLYLKYHNRKKREIVEYNKLDDVLANELVPSNIGGAIYSAVGASVSIPCVYKNEVVEREHFTRYVWTSLEDKVVPLSDRVRETTDGVLKISDVTVKDGGNYTCSVNRPFGTTEAEHKRFRHELKIVERPIFKIETTIMYNTEETCSLKHGDIIHNHLPKLLEELLCGLHKRVCKVEMERPNCVTMEDNTYLSFKYAVALDALPSLIPSLTYEKCDFDCQMKIYGSLISLLIKNVETINFLNIVSEMKTSNHTFKPREIKFPTDRKTVEDTTLFPMLLIGCPPGFGIQQKTNKICVACPRNYYSADNSSSCVPCPFIHFQPNLGSTGCLECRTPFEDKSCVGMVLANRSFLIIYIGSTVAIIFLILLCVFCAQSVGTPAKKKKNTQTPKRRRMGRRDIEDPAEKTLLLKDTGSRKVVKGPKVPPPDFY